jgi:muramoyltetrapeptide carboxypeptidase LdcA involved in peptidoglycan recycling
LIGTPFGDVANFRKQFINNEPIVWYFENCEINTTDLKRTLVQMKLAGWFENCSGILFGRSSANEPIDDYTAEDVYRDLAEDLQIPIIYDVDCGHQPPQMTFVNGAYAEVEVEEGKGTVLQHFR